MGMGGGAAGFSIELPDGNHDYIKAPGVWKRSARAGDAIGAGALISIWTPGAGRKIRVLGGSITPLAASIVILNEGSTGGADGTQAKDFWNGDFVGTAYGPVEFNFGPNGFLFLKDEQLLMYSSAATSVVWTIWGREESATVAW